VQHILDLCGGSGAVGQLMMAAAPRASLHAIDLDPVQIELAAENYAGLGYRVVRNAPLAAPAQAGGERTVSLTVGSADQLPFPEASFDCVMIANAIHLIGDKQALISAIARVLKPGGRLLIVDVKRPSTHLGRGLNALMLHGRLKTAIQDLPAMLNDAGYIGIEAGATEFSMLGFVRAQIRA
jgi:ubiquinone/menaquinone biosynthesis C-methylase UbiE